jgi:hypothetical protein
MSNIFLAINCGMREGWRLEPFDTAFEAFNAVKSGFANTYGYEWKIVRELEIKIEDENK